MVHCILFHSVPLRRMLLVTYKADFITYKWEATYSVNTMALRGLPSIYGHNLGGALLTPFWYFAAITHCNLKTSAF